MITNKIFLNLLKRQKSLYRKTQYFHQVQQRSPEELPYLELTRDFLDPQVFYKTLLDRGIDFFTGVPDSLLKDFCGFVQDHHPKEKHIITANEGSAIALAAGYHLATNKIPLVYLQNSGLGNIINPIMSLAHPQVYGIPMLVLIGWRGEPGKKDEPQHMVQGKTMNGIVTEMGISYEVLPDYQKGAEVSIDNAIYNAKKRNTPFFLIIKRQHFLAYKCKSQVTNQFTMNREQALNIVQKHLKKHDVVIGTTGFLSRELYEHRETNNDHRGQDFYCVGSMGYASSIATGVAQIKQSRDVFCLDGDGAALMHLGTFSVIGQLGQVNFKHIIFNNQCHDSVGAQPTPVKNLDFCMIAQGCGYKKTYRVTTKEELDKIMPQIHDDQGPLLLEIMIKPGVRNNLGRPKSSPTQNKDKFMQFLNI